MTAVLWAGVMVLGGIGAVCRLLVDRAVSRRFKSGFPVGTLAVSPHVALLAGTAFVGAYTTFSTWMLETQRLGEERQGRAAALNIVISVVLGVAAAWLGQQIGRPL